MLPLRSALGMCPAFLAFLDHVARYGYGGMQVRRYGEAFYVVSYIVLFFHKDVAHSYGKDFALRGTAAPFLGGSVLRNLTPGSAKSFVYADGLSERVFGWYPEAELWPLASSCMSISSVAFSSLAMETREFRGSFVRRAWFRFGWAEPSRLLGALAMQRM